MGERASHVERFDRSFFGSGATFSRIGGGALGGKAEGLLFADKVLASVEGPGRDAFELRIPRCVILGTDVFDAFLDRNGLRALAGADESDARIAQAFQAAAMPAEVVGDLRSIVEEVRVPLAVRSSSLLEDALLRPFAGVYETKMTPNDQPDPAERFRKLVEAIKLVYASTFFHAARTYKQVTGYAGEEEKMAVILQEVVGSRRWERFYPTLAAVGRSYDFYATSPARPEEGVVSLVLGLGKSIVDGGACWTYSPARPKAPAPFGSPRDLLQYSQSRFWAVRMGRPPIFDPIAETEYLVEADLAAAEYDGTLDQTASTYDPASDRIVVGVSRPGPRVLDFGPLLRLGDSPFSALVRDLFTACRQAAGDAVEIEMAVDWSPQRPRPLFGFLQVRPMRVASTPVELTDEEMQAPVALLAARRAVGNGVREDIHDVVYLRPDAFVPQATVQMAREVAAVNAELLAAGRPYLLIGFGRWGTTDPWGGIPVRWADIAGARVIVEASLPTFQAEPSQGSHFFHNVTSLGVLYLSLDEREQRSIDWSWLGAQDRVREGTYVRHVRTRAPLVVKVDGLARRGAVLKPRSSGGDATGHHDRHEAGGREDTK